MLNEAFGFCCVAFECVALCLNVLRLSVLCCFRVRCVAFEYVVLRLNLLRCVECVALCSSVFECCFA